MIMMNADDNDEDDDGDGDDDNDDDDDEGAMPKRDEVGGPSLEPTNDTPLIVGLWAHSGKSAVVKGGVPRRRARVAPQ